MWEYSNIANSSSACNLCRIIYILSDKAMVSSLKTHKGSREIFPLPLGAQQLKLQGYDKMGENCMQKSASLFPAGPKLVCASMSKSRSSIFAT